MSLFSRPCPQFFALFASLIAATLCISVAHAQQNAALMTETKATPVKTAALPGLVIFNPKNHHYYQSFSGSYTWEEANKKALEHTYNGAKGHLATVTSQDEYDFIVNSLFVYDYWIGAYRDLNKLKVAPDFGWTWITNEPWGYTNWNENEPANKEAVQHFLSFWTGSMKWAKRVGTDKDAGYVVEYPVAKPAGETTTQATPTQQIDSLLTTVTKSYGKLNTYSADVEFTFKAFTDTVENVRASLMMNSSGQFRLEGRGENGKLLAISDGKRLMLALTEPGKRMKFVVKPMSSLDKALKEAFSLLTSSPKPPSITGLITGTFDQKIYTSNGIVGEYIEGDSPQQVIRSKASMLMPGEDAVDGNLYLALDLDKKAFTQSSMDFRYKAYPYTVKETHSNIKINEPIPGNNFVLVITTNAEQVDDLGEGDDVDVSYSVPPVKK